MQHRHPLSRHTRQKRRKARGPNLAMHPFVLTAMLAALAVGIWTIAMHVFWFR